MFRSILGKFYKKIIIWIIQVRVAKISLHILKWRSKIEDVKNIHYVGLLFIYNLIIKFLWHFFWEIIYNYVKNILFSI